MKNVLSPLLGALFSEPLAGALPASADAPKSSEAPDTGNSSFDDEMQMALAGGEADVPLTRLPEVETDPMGAFTSTPVVPKVSTHPPTPRPITLAPPLTRAVTEKPDSLPVNSTGVAQLFSQLPGVIQPASKPQPDEEQDALVLGRSEPAGPVEIKVPTGALAEWIGLHSISAPIEPRAPELSNPGSNWQTTCRVLESGGSVDRAGDDSISLLASPPIARPVEKNDPAGGNIANPKAQSDPKPAFWKADLPPPGIAVDEPHPLTAGVTAPGAPKPSLPSLSSQTTPDIGEPKQQLKEPQKVEPQLDSQIWREEPPGPVSEKLNRQEAGAERNPETLDALQASSAKFGPPARAVREISQTSEAQSPTVPGGMSRAESSPWMKNEPESGRIRPLSGQELPSRQENLGAVTELPRADAPADAMTSTTPPQQFQQLPVDARISSTPIPGASIEVAGVLSSLAALESADRVTPTSEVQPASADGSGIQIVRELRAAIPAHAVELRQSKSESITVVLRPDSETALQLQLSGRDGHVDVRAQLEHGNFHALNAHWSGLQQALSAQGISLGALQESGVGSLVGGGTPDGFRRAQQEMENADLEWAEPQALRQSPIQDSSGHPQSRPASSSRTWESWA